MSERWLISARGDRDGRPTLQHRGFSLLEVVIVIGIIALLVGIGIPLLTPAKKKSQLNQAVRDLAANLNLARTLAGSRRRDSSWAPSDHTVNAGIRIISPTQYAVFIDRNEQLDGDEVDTQFVDFTARDPSSDLRIMNAPPEVRFGSNGALRSSTTVDLVIQDSATAEKHVVRVSLGGSAKQVY